MMILSEVDTESLDPAQLAHIKMSPWLPTDMCTCRTRDSGERFYTCRRTACEGEGKVCGGHCHSCFRRIVIDRPRQPEVVVLCGSTRFRTDFERETRRLGLEGKIVLSVSMFGHDGDLPPEQCVSGHPTKDALDELHLRKIDLADRVLVINPGGYVGSSTRREIEYATWFEKPIEYLVSPADGVV